jgi:hypothetical protein
MSVLENTGDIPATLLRDSAVFQRDKLSVVTPAPFAAVPVAGISRMPSSKVKLSSNERREKQHGWVDDARESPHDRLLDTDSESFRDRSRFGSPGGVMANSKVEIIVHVATVRSCVLCRASRVRVIARTPRHTRC